MDMLESLFTRGVTAGKGVCWTGPYTEGGMLSTLALLIISDKVEWEDLGLGGFEGVSD